MVQPEGGTRRALGFRFPIRVRWEGHGLDRWIHPGIALVRPTPGGCKDQCCRPPEGSTTVDVLREISSCRYVSRCRVELQLAFRCGAVLDRQPLLVFGQEFVGGQRGADLSTHPLCGIGHVPEQELRDQRAVQNAWRRDGVALRVSRVEIKHIGTEQRPGRNPPTRLRSPEVGKLVEFFGCGKHVAIGGVVAQFGQRNITKQGLPIYLDRLAAALRTCKGWCRRYRNLSRVYAAETDGQCAYGVDQFASAAERDFLEISGIARLASGLEGLPCRLLHFAASVVRQAP